ncbi:UDP-glucose 4-epimerase GalE [Bombilactobacillus folatiphilus]|uniref:UDP-glucose 4-epimerase n=1 Tax=Bombilactobacillus folatiphilus TaxID=2923362 RepID=A0ABY4PAI0_9LACO|nr:UDP-glucose 4-epimerase GalE [Bombilactobacillus folatiphilus]UQS82753.1 UDP-glucose 4-epimerase GalE [Bombilactobacillus folatiphilus]
MAILVLGGAGYIGSHMVDLLVQKKEDVVVVDNLSYGHRQAVPESVPFYQGDVRDHDFLEQVFTQHDIEAVFHFCAYIQVPESVVKPNDYFDNNVVGLISLINVMKNHQVKKLIFSSSAAVYGTPERVPIKEDDAKDPINPYGLTKLMMEQIMRWDGAAYEMQWLAFRYFNVAGARLDGNLGEDHRPETHLIPIVLQAALGQREHVEMCGNDYQTRDGYNVRDYVHVLDLVQAHYFGLEYLRQGGQSDYFNIGSKQGFTVKEIVEAARRVTGVNIKAIDAPRRGGDPDSLVADSTKIRTDLGWQSPHTDIDTIISSAWNWLQKHPNGYSK